MRQLTFISMLVLLVACAAEKEYNTPKDVARVWLENYYNNDFEEAKAYSTNATQAMIDTIRTTIFTDLEDVLDFKIKSVACKEVGETATCDYVYQEGQDKIPEKIDLKKVDGQWLVDMKLLNEEEILNDSEVEDMFKEFEQSLDKELQRK